ncbi:MAG: hypothetical protein E7050_01425 [Lentisphaerae bacterium]|nr:hypothetical protein [Lentisphaerota bacterium]
MKKLLLIILSAVVVSSAFAGEFDSKGVISGWKFAPVQVGVGIFESANLFDADSVALFSIGLAGIQQQASIISLGGMTRLENNYGIQLSAASLTDRNYGLMIGLLENCTDVNKNYGIKIGITNISGKFAKYQLLGIDFFDYLQVGFLNGHTYIDNVLQIGIFNTTSNDGVQIGLLNYNENALIKWMPLFNFSWH